MTKTQKNKKHRALDNILNVDEWQFQNAFVFCRDSGDASGRVRYLPWYMILFLRPTQLPEGMFYDVDLSEL